VSLTPLCVVLSGMPCHVPFSPAFGPKHPSWFFVSSPHSSRGEPRVVDSYYPVVYSCQKCVSSHYGGPGKSFVRAPRWVPNVLTENELGECNSVMLGCSSRNELLSGLG